ncbi:MAG: hypothetical protein SOY30_12920 [Eubacteriales bacterium]|nr:hypothetical protein [Eubacteriales bacterium]
MVQIDVNQMARALMQSYPGLDEAAAQRYAQAYRARLHPMLQGCVESWMAGRRIENVAYAAEGEEGFSLRSIMGWRCSNDYLQAMLLLSDYINDPGRGRARILAPIRSRL